MRDRTNENEAKMFIVSEGVELWHPIMGTDEWDRDRVSEWRKVETDEGDTITLTGRTRVFVEQEHTEVIYRGAVWWLEGTLDLIVNHWDEMLRAV